MKKLLVAGVLSLGLLFVGNQVTNAEIIYPEVDTTYNKYIEEYLVEDYQKNMIFSKITFDRVNSDKVITLDGNIDCYVFNDVTIRPNGEKRDNDRAVPISLWESKFTEKPKVNTEYILVIKRNEEGGKGYFKTFEHVDIIEIEKPKKTFKVPKKLKN